MKAELYTRIVLTVIAIELGVLDFGQFRPNSAQAQTELLQEGLPRYLSGESLVDRNGHKASVPIDVRIVGVERGLYSVANSIHDTERGIFQYDFQPVVEPWEPLNALALPSNYYDTEIKAHITNAAALEADWNESASQDYEKEIEARRAKELPESDGWIHK